MNRVDDVAFISGNNYALDPIRIGNNQIHYKKCSRAKQTHGIFRPTNEWRNFHKELRGITLYRLFISHKLQL